MAVGVGSRPTARRRISRRSCTIASKQPALIQRWVCWYTSSHGGRFVGSIRHAAPARTIQRSALKTSRNSYFRCGASSRTRARYGATNAHSSSLTSLGYGFRAVRVVSIPKLYGIHRTELLTPSMPAALLALLLLAATVDPRLAEPLRLLAELHDSDGQPIGAEYAATPEALHLTLMVASMPPRVGRLARG